MSGNKTLIVLVSYNHWEMTVDCIRSLQHLPKEEFATVIFDNCSDKETTKNLRKIIEPIQDQFFLIESDENLGFGRANNRAIEICHQKFPFTNLCLLNNDTIVSKDCLPKLLDVLRNNPNAIVAPQTLNKDGSQQKNYYANIFFKQFFFNAFRSKQKAADYLHGIPANVNATGTIQKTDWTAAICWCMTMETWNTVGGFDKNIFMYYEDVDFALRAKDCGFEYLINNEATLTHLDGGSAKSTLSRSLQHDNAQEYMFKKHWGLKGLIISKAFRIIRSSIRLLTVIPKAIASTQSREYALLHFKLLVNAFKV